MAWSCQCFFNFIHNTINKQRNLNTVDNENKTGRSGPLVPALMVRSCHFFHCQLCLSKTNSQMKEKMAASDISANADSPELPLFLIVNCVCQKQAHKRKRKMAAPDHQRQR
ncbi:hypothetical protein O6H91_02G055000 [Diphasiastrum complanatum]|uniref:Uncharacterized protein n=1 Tax=Diphasiastrum complanatum TaxID=34168 RepID=A0ACC2EFX9_DIPCM|nr:hypothetical protein O6H91_02G055000 [Diphasiastrum complanatum]